MIRTANPGATFGHEHSLPKPDPQLHWDPTPAERRYFRHTSTGDLGYVVRREGKDCIRLDREMQEIIQPFRDGQWVEEREFKPFTLHQVAQLAFAADCALCRMMGKHKEAKAEYMTLPEKVRIDFMQNGPGEGGLRSELFKAIMKTLKPHSR